MKRYVLVIFTILLCIVGFMPRADAGAVQVSDLGAYELNRRVTSDITQYPNFSSNGKLNYIKKNDPLYDVYGTTFRQNNSRVTVLYYCNKAGYVSDIKLVAKRTELGSDIFIAAMVRILVNLNLSKTEIHKLIAHENQRDTRDGTGLYNLVWCRRANRYILKWETTAYRYGEAYCVMAIGAIS